MLKKMLLTTKFFLGLTILSLHVLLVSSHSLSPQIFNETSTLFDTNQNTICCVNFDGTSYCNNNGICCRVKSGCQQDSFTCAPSGSTCCGTSYCSSGSKCCGGANAECAPQGATCCGSKYCPSGCQSPGVCTSSGSGSVETIASLSVGAIIGISVGSVAGVIVVMFVCIGCCLYCCCWKGSQQQPAQQPTHHIINIVEIPNNHVLQPAQQPTQHVNLNSNFTTPTNNRSFSNSGSNIPVVSNQNMFSNMPPTQYYSQQPMVVVSRSNLS